MPRPKITPTAEDRRLVRTLSAYGVPQEGIAKRIGIRSPKTLRKYFREELDGGSLEANCKVAQTMFQMATSGKDMRATMFWLQARAGWNDRPAFTPAITGAAPPFVVARAPEARTND
jgi:hypothetical protein